MDSGLVTVLISSVVAIIVALVTALLMRRSSKESNDVRRIELILDSQRGEIDSLKGDVTSLKTEVKELQKENGDLRLERETDRSSLARVRGILRTWFPRLLTAWGNHLPSMPVPADEDLEFLGILPRK